MKGSTHAEKEWLHKMMTGKENRAEEQTSTVQAAAKEPEQKKNVKKKKQGFKDVAGMDKLKQLVTDGFINVLNNSECAKAYGITPIEDRKSVV